MRPNGLNDFPLRAKQPCRARHACTSSDKLCRSGRRGGTSGCGGPAARLCGRPVRRTVCNAQDPVQDDAGDADAEDETKHSKEHDGKAVHNGHYSELATVGGVRGAAHRPRQNARPMGRGSSPGASVRGCNQSVSRRPPRGKARRSTPLRRLSTTWGRRTPSTCVCPPLESACP